MVVLRQTQQHETLFVSRMTRIGNYQPEWITEYGCRFIERDFMFDEIGGRFSRVPLELQRQALLYLRTVVGLEIRKESSPKHSVFLQLLGGPRHAFGLAQVAPVLAVGAIRHDALSFACQP